MSRDIWNPSQYREYSSERARPFFELLARVDLEAPRHVVDLGCGPGERTLDLAARWPDAIIDGIDGSEQMITEAHRLLEKLGDPNAEADVRARPAPAPAPGTEPGTGPTAGGGVAAESLPGLEAMPVPGLGSGPEAGAGAEAESAPGTAREGDRRFEGEVGARAGSGGEDRPNVRFAVGDLAAWTPERPVDVIFSNAALQWVPGHRRLLPGWVAGLAPGGRLAFSMPGNFGAPSHVILRELSESPRWRDRLAGTIRHNVVGEPDEYLLQLAGLGCDVDAWETTYLQVLPGEDPVLAWMKGTALRPVFDALPDPGDRADFLADLAPRLREAYPRGEHGTVFPFRRIFVVARRP